MARLTLIVSTDPVLAPVLWLFLDDRQNPAKTPAYDRWIRLDFLGFSRPNLDLSMGYADKTEKDFSTRFCRRERAVETGNPRFGMRKERIAHGASLTRLLIVCKILPPGAVGSRRYVRFR